MEGAKRTYPIAPIDAPGYKVDRQLAEDLRREVAGLVGRSSISFPGAQPVSFKTQHLDELRQRDYYVCEKSDGIRYLLYVTKDEAEQEAVYLIDRKNDYWFIADRNLHFPRRGGQDADFVPGTLLDGELVMDEAVDEQGRRYKEPKFLVFDVLMLDSKNMMTRSLDKRLAYIKENVMVPYEALLKKYPQEIPMQAFKVEMKSMQFSYGMEMMFREVLPKLKHGSDGLIFTCRESEYHHGTDPQILKWKPASENSIDFRLALFFPLVEPDEEERMDGMTEPFIDYDSIPRAQLYEFMGGGGHGSGFNPSGPGESRPPYRFFADLYLSEDDWETLKSTGDPLIGRIVECVMDEDRRWTLVRFRDDKDEANHVSTVNSVMESIEDSVSEQQLLEAAKSIKDNWKLRAQRR